MTQSIAITGSGIICAIGTDKSSVLRSLKAEQRGIATKRFLNTTHTKLPVGEVKFSDNELKDLLGISTEKEYSRTTLLGAIALRQAMAEAALTPQQLEGKRVLFVSGTTVGGMDVTERHFGQMLNGASEASFISQHDCGSNTEEIASLCGLNCEMTTISTACSSALNAIILGTRMLLADKADIAIVGGSEALTRFHLNGFNSLMILDTEPCSPFDKNRKGLNLGEGAAYLVLERDCIEKALGYIAGFGNRCDAYHQTATSAEGEGAFLAMADTLSMSDVNIDEIDYINAHGTGTPDNDKSESAAIKRLFGCNIPPVSSTKGYTGHTTSASGSIETVISLLAMQNNFIPANLGWENSDKNCIEPVLGATDITIHHVLCNSFGFGGNDSSLLISKEEKSLCNIENRNFSMVGENKISSEEDLKEIREYVSPIEARRMSKILKASILTSMRALHQSGIERPDAIIIATKYGMLEQGEKILTYLESYEEGLSPTSFIQSTHNTIAGTLAIRLKCRGYNITYSHGEKSLEWAVNDAELLIAEGKAKSVLVGYNDYCPTIFRDIFCKAGLEQPMELYSKSMVIVAKE